MLPLGSGCRCKKPPPRIGVTCPPPDRGLRGLHPDRTWPLQYDRGGLKGSGTKKGGAEEGEEDEEGAVAAPADKAKGKKPGEDKEESFYDSSEFSAEGGDSPR